MFALLREVHAWRSGEGLEGAQTLWEEEEDAKRNYWRRQVMDFCDARFSAWENVKECVDKVLQGAELN